MNISLKSMVNIQKTMRFSRCMSRIVWQSALVLSAIHAQPQPMQHARLTLQIGHTVNISSLAFSPSGKFIATGSWLGPVLLWDLPTGKQLRQFPSPFTTGLAFSPDGRDLLIAGDNNAAVLWDVETGKKLRQFDGEFLSVAFSANGKYVLTGGLRGTAQLWDAASSNEVKRFNGHSGSIQSVAISTDGSLVVTGGEDKTARLWNALTGVEFRRLIGHSGPVKTVAISPDGRFVITGSNDGTARLWDAISGSELRQFKSSSGGVSHVVFSADGNYVFVGTTNGGARMWRIADGKELKGFELEGENTESLAVSSDGNLLATASGLLSLNFGRGTTHVWDIGTGKEVVTLDSRVELVTAVSTNSQYLLTRNSSGAIRVRAASSPQALREIQGLFSFNVPCAVSSDGALVLIAGDDNSAQLYDVVTGREIRRFLGHTKRIESISFSPDGHHALTGAGPDDKSVILWDVFSGQKIRQFDGLPDSVGFSADGNYIFAVGTDQTVRLWDTATGKLHWQEDQPSGLKASAVVSKDDKFILTASSDLAQTDVWLWSMTGGLPLEKIQSHSKGINSMAFSTDGHEILIGGADGISALYEAETGQEIRKFDAHFPVLHADFSPSGEQIILDSADGARTLWERKTGRKLASFFFLNDGSWAAVDAAGHYDASDPDNSSSLYWVTDNLRTIDLGQLKKEYYTPGLLARVMRGERLPDVTDMDIVALPPVLSIAKEYDPSTHTLQLAVQNDGGGAGRLMVKVNDRLLRTIDHPGSPAENKSAIVSIDLSDAPFVTGDNTIRVTAYDASNRIESQAAISVYHLAATAKGGIPAAPSSTALNPGRFFAIIVGTSTFGDPRLNLQFPAHDAESMATGLRLGAERLYGKDHVWMRVLTSDAASTDVLPTKQNIRAAFEEVRRQAQPEDTLVVYLSGHGAVSSQNRDLYYYLTADARTLDVDSDPVLRDVSTVSSAELFEWLREPVKTMPLKEVVILDTCAAGGAGNDLMKLAEKRDVPPDQKRAIELLKDATGTFILMGSAADSVSYEASKYGEGLLTYALLQGMRGSSLDDGSRLGVSRWFEDASEQVPELSKSIGGIQRPIIAAPRGRGFPVALLNVEDRIKIPLAMPKPELLRVSCEDADGLDPLHLRRLLREQLRALVYAQSRGRQDVSVMYLDSTDDDLPGALRPSVRYQVSAEKVSVRIRLIADEKSVTEETMSLSGKDPMDLAVELARKIVAMAAADR
jgi:WD40 repeat protein